MLMRFDPFREVDRVAEQVDQVFRRGTSVMPMDAVRRGDRVFVNFDLPGVDPDSIDLTVERDMLTVTATRRFEKSEGDEVLASERPQGTFTRRVLLGESLDTSQLEAAYDHGVLSVTIPVAEQAQPRKIAVGGGHSGAAIEAESHETRAEPGGSEG
ncbi:MAG TPA: Hsp20/alpha crystallin family protein [Acidimicrobiales bacterium]|jgi:HSP20 family protein|nr:Hsp20/alpha crystallin family protein [Acidimicrobiales bacterium]